MSFTYGFYNAVDHDRRYDAIQMSSLFDGIIRDGILSSIGNCMKVTAGSGMTVNVGTGRAWFNHTWSLNDSIMPVEIEASSQALDRIDIVALEVNSSASVRANSIKVIKGVPASDPQRPTLEHSEYVNQYALADIRVPRSATSIVAANITNRVGGETPLATGLLQQVSIQNLLSNWTDQKDDMLGDMRTSFDQWFAQVVDTLDEDTAGKLQIQIDKLKTQRTFRLETDLSGIAQNSDIFANGYMKSWPIFEVTATCVPEYILPVSIDYAGDVVAETRNGEFRLYFESSIPASTQVTLLWRETKLYGSED